MNAMIVENPEVARIFSTGMSDYRALSKEDRLRFRFLIGQWILAYESVYVQHEIGTLGKHVFESRMRNLELWLNNEGGLAAWDTGKEVFSRDYVEYVEKNVIHR